MRLGDLRLERRSDGAPWMQRRGAAAAVGGAVIVLAGYVLLLGRGASWLDAGSLRGLTPEQRATEIDSMRGYLIQAGAGVLAFGALVYTALNFRLSREGHVTDRYTKAIEQLGSDQLDVRLGAIYALERIMIDSVRDHPTIVEVLAAYLREHTAMQRFQVITPYARDMGISTPHLELPEKPATDVQAALTVLGRRPRGRLERGGIDLRGTYLRGADLSGAWLDAANLHKADLSDALLSATRLFRANLSDARLAGTWILGADMAGARLLDADLTNAHINGTDLARASLKNADFTGALLANTDVTDDQRAEAKGLSDGGS